jgi:hypothetical protein
MKDEQESGSNRSKQRAQRGKENWINLILCSLCFLLFNPLLLSAAAPIQLHINTAIDTPAAALKKAETNFTTLFQSITELTNTITFYGATNSPVDFSTTAFQLAIDSSKGAAVIVPKGRYWIDATIDLPDNTRLIGDGMSSELVLTNVDVGLSAYGKTNIQIIGLKFSGKYSQAVAALFCTNVLVRECEFTDATRIPQSGWIAPVRSQSSFGVHVQACRFYGNGNALATFEASAEILIGGTADITRAVVIEDCVLVGNKTHYGIATLDMQDGRVLNNWIAQGNTIGVLNLGGYGIQSVGTMGLSAQRNIFAGNTITNAAGSGIYLSNNISAKVFDNHIANVTIQQSSAIAQAGGIVLESSALSAIAHNVVTNSPVAGLASTGAKNSILDNTLVNVGAAGTGILLTGSDTTVDRNFIRGFATGINNTGASNRVGILNLIHDNTVPLADAGGAVVKTITTGATPSVRDAPSYLLNYSVPTSITDFSDGLPGMDRTFFAANTNVTLINSAGLLLNGGADLHLLTGQILVLRRDAASAWHQVAGVGSVNFQSGGETNTASNLGTNGTLVQGLFSAKSVHDLQFRSLAAGTGITLSSNAATVVITAVPATQSPASAAYVGTGRQIIAGRGLTGGGDLSADVTLAFSYADTLISNTLAANEVEFAFAGILFEGTIADAFEGMLIPQNPTADRIWALPNASGTVAVSASTPLALDIFGNLTITNIPLDRIVGSEAFTSGGETNTASNLGTASATIQGLAATKSALDLRFRSLEAGSGVTLTSNATTVVIASTSGASGEANTASNLGTASATIQGLANTKSGLDLRFRSLEAGAGVTLSSNATTVTIASSTGLGDPVSAGHGGMGSDLSGSLSGAIPFFNLATGKFTSTFTAYTNSITYNSGMLSISRTNITGFALLSLAEGGGSVPFILGYTDRFDAANTNFSLGTAMGYAVRLRIEDVAGLQLTKNLSTVIGDGSSTTTRTNKFLYVPTFGGVPTGVPAVELAGTVPLGYDTVGDQLYFYNGAWVKLNASRWVGAGTNATLTGLAAANSAILTNGLTVLDVTASSLVRTDSAKKLAPVTIGSNMTFDGTTLAANNANLRANGTTNADLSGILTANSVVITNRLTLAGVTGARFLGVSSGGIVDTSFTSLRLADTLIDEVGTGGVVFSIGPALTDPSFVGTPTSISLAITNALTLYAQTLSRVLAVDASKNVSSSFASSVLAATLTDETGTGLAVFATGPVLTTPTNSGVATFTDRRRQTGVISPTQITSDKNDYNPTGLAAASVVRVNSDAARNITGLLAGIAGDELLLFNSGSFNITLNSQSVSSDATNRFAFAADIGLFPGSGATLFYDGTSSRWRMSGVGAAIHPTITTGSPGSGAAPWALGTVITGATVALVTTNYAEVMIGGVLKKVGLVQ